MKDPNWYTRKRLSHRPRNPRAKQGLGPSYQRRPTRDLRALVARFDIQLGEEPPRKPRVPTIPERMVHKLFEATQWGGTVGGKMALLNAAIQSLANALNEGWTALVGKVLANREDRDGEEVWPSVLRAFSRDIGLDADEACAFVERGVTIEGKQERLAALVAAFDLGGRDGAIQLVFDDLARVV